MRLWCSGPRRGSRLLLWGVSALSIAGGRPVAKSTTDAILPQHVRTTVNTLRTRFGLAATSLELGAQLGAILHVEGHLLPVDGLAQRDLRRAGGRLGGALRRCCCRRCRWLLGGGTWW